MDCIFCKIIAGEIPCIKLYEDEDTLAFMDINPAADGHSLVIPRAHAPNIFDINADDIGKTAAVASKIATAVNAALSPDGINILQANGPGAAQSVHHFHFHIIPRSNGDRLMMNWEQMTGKMDHIAAIADRIIEKL